MSMTLRGISSMATKPLLAELAAACEQSTGVTLRIESVGGVDAAARVQAGEAFDFVVLAEDAIKQLQGAGKVAAPRTLGISQVAIAVPAGTARPDVSSVDLLRAALLAAPKIGYSTGPSGTALLKLIERWGLADALAGRLLQARPGVPVAAMLAAEEAQLGFQQFSELSGQAGIDLLGGMPPDAAIVTHFVGAVATTSAQPESALAALDFMAAPAQDAIRAAQGMLNTKKS